MSTSVHLHHALATSTDPAVARLISTRGSRDRTQARNLERRFRDRLQAVHQVAVNGDSAHCVPGIVNQRFAGVKSESLMVGLPVVAFSNGSACMSVRAEPSNVLRAMGLDDDSAHCSRRFSFGRFTTAQEIDHAAERLWDAVAELRTLSFVWHGTCSTDRRVPDRPEGGVRVA